VLSGLVAVWFWGPGRARAAAEKLPTFGAVPPFQLAERSGVGVGRDDLLGAPWIAGLIFTRCKIECPRLTERMVELDLPAGMRRVGISVDPTHDTPAVLTAWARQHRVAGRDWLLLTGGEAEVRRLAVEGFKLGIDRAGDPATAPELITHSTRIVLVDPAGQIRGYYDADDAKSRDDLERDAGNLGAAAGLGRARGAAR